MQLCDDGHDEIIHCERYCPLCAAIGERDDLQSTVDELQTKIEELESKVDELNSAE